MSGIIGIYFFDKRPVEKHHLEKMLEAISYRGPDDSGIWFEGAIGLGNCLLRTTPESLNEKLPLISKRGDLVLIADARIDNRDELLKTLNISNSNITDSELILTTYEAWKERCAEKLVGDFAFAIWDRNNQKLFCARDIEGARPFYYYKGEGFFIFASDPQAIFALPFINKKLNKAALLDFILFNFGLEDTEFENIYQLIPAHTLSIKECSLEDNEYMSIDQIKTLKLNSIKEYEEAFLDVFKKAVISNLRTNGNTGVLFSGGFDSSSILCMAEDLITQKKVIADVCAYSTLYPGEPCDEKEYILSVQKKWQTEIHFVESKMLHAPWELQNTSWADSQPFWYDTFTFEEIAIKAKEDKIKVLLSGLGGDDIISTSLSSATDLILSGHLFRAWKYTKNFGKFHDTSYWYAIKHILPEIVRDFIPNPLKKLRTYLAVYRRYPWLTKEYKNLAVQHLRRRPASLKNHKLKTNDMRTLYHASYYGHLTRTIQDLEKTFLRTSNIELRMPFLDKRLIEFTLSVPPDVLDYDEEQKGLLRRVLNSYLPEKIRNRTWKTSFTTHLNKQLIGNNTENIKKLLTSSRLEALGIINGAAARNEYKAFSKKYTNQVSKTKGAISKLYPLLYLEAWLREIENRSNLKLNKK
ncbi:MAG: hypothetical protein HY094_09210 [Candidatus Melainabacteria bacterium]|nr:hypothetical protein [Candidatus Melainabacteria bacterium]